jgi:HPt (histidine-containing phosphotransfer) domain-containing protein
MFYKHGFQAFISKPIDVMEMDSVIRKWVRNESRGDAPIFGTPGTDALGTDASAAPSEDENIVIAGLDAQKGLAFYAGETDIFISLLRSYAANIPNVLDKLRAVSAETLSDYVITVHGLKGTSAGIGAETVREAAAKLETMSRAGNLDGVLSRNDSLITDTENIAANLKAWLERYDAVHKKPRLKAPDREVLARLRQSCTHYDMSGIDQAMSELESADYEENGDLVAWLREKINISEIAEVAARLKENEDAIC